MPITGILSLFALFINLAIIGLAIYAVYFLLTRVHSIAKDMKEIKEMIQESREKND